MKKTYTVNVRAAYDEMEGAPVIIVEVVSPDREPESTFYVECEMLDINVYRDVE